MPLYQDITIFIMTFHDKLHIHGTSKAVIMCLDNICTSSHNTLHFGYQQRQQPSLKCNCKIKKQANKQALSCVRMYQNVCTGLCLAANLYMGNMTVSIKKCCGQFSFLQKFCTSYIQMSVSTLFSQFSHHENHTSQCPQTF